MVPLLKGQPEGWRGALFCEYFQEPNFPRTPTWQCVRGEHWKLIHYPGHPEWDEMYDLEKDRHELKNRIKDLEVADERKELTVLLGKLRQETGAK